MPAFLIGPKEAQRRGREYMDSHGLQDWKLVWDKRTKRFGACYPTEKIISLSAYLLHKGWVQFEETLKHEVAHALTPNDPGHGVEWKRKAVELGASPHAKCSERLVEEPMWILRCPCGSIATKVNKILRRYRTGTCRRCHGRLQITKNPNATGRISLRTVKRTANVYR